MTSELRVSMISLGVTAMERSVAFYTDARFGAGGLPGELTFVKAGAITLLLNRPLGAAVQPVAGAVEIIFRVDSVAASYTALSQKGCTFKTAPREVTPGTWTATLPDPDGHLLTFLGAP